MNLQKVLIHNYRSLIDAEVDIHGYTILVGANNSGKSTFINALRAFYGDLKWSNADLPKIGMQGKESWIQLVFELTEQEWDGLADKYKKNVNERSLTVRRYFYGSRARVNQSNIYAIINGEPESEFFYGARNISTAKVGSVVYIPALTTPGDQMKTSGPSPLRGMLQYLLKKVVKKSPAYGQLQDAFSFFNTEAQKPGGFLTEITSPINQSLSDWNVAMEFEINSASPDDITKNLIQHSFSDAALNESMALDHFGHGFQRSVIYELIRIAPTFSKEDKPLKKEFNPEFTLILFEEPEAFLHPAQQENMAYHLRELGKGGEQQVIVTSHSSIFVGKTGDSISQIVRLHRGQAVSMAFQIERGKQEEVFEQGGDLQRALEIFVSDPSIEENKKGEARKLLANPPSSEVHLQQERFRFQLWLDSARASMFFADRVLLVEGETERALFNYLLANNWRDLTKHRIFVVDALGKYNFHRFMTLFEAFGIPHGVILDSDDDKNHHEAINQLILSRKNRHTLADPVLLDGCLERVLGQKASKRNDRKPLEMLQAIESGNIGGEGIAALRKIFCEALDLAM